MKFVIVMHLAGNPLRGGYTSLPTDSHIRTIIVTADSFSEAIDASGVGNDCEKLEVYPVSEER